MFSWWNNLSVRFKGLIVVLIPITALLLSLFFVSLSRRAEVRADDVFAQKVVVKDQSRKVLTLLVDAETGVRGYLASEEEQFLEPYERARKRLPGAIKELQAMVKDPIAMRTIDPLAPIAQRELDTLGALRGAGSANSEPTIRLLRKGKRQMDRVRGIFGGLVARENVLLARSTAIGHRADRAVAVALIVTSIVGVGGALLAMLIFVLGVVRRVEKVRDKADLLAKGRRLGMPDLSRDEIGALDQDLHTAGELLAKRQEDLILARDEADAANQAKSDFLSRMSHELRTPLNAILGFGQLLERGQMQGTDRDYVGQIMKAGRHLLALINDVLDIARIEAGRMNLSLEPVDVSDVVQEVVDLIQPLAKQRDVRFEFDSDDLKLRSVVADRQRLKQVFLNLASNAIKFNRPGGLVSIRSRPAPEGRIRLDIIDTGYGISSDQIGRLFAEFERLGADSSGAEGTGLGLALTKNLVQAMNGTIEVESEEGSGSTFSIELPLADLPDQVTAVPTLKAVRQNVVGDGEATILYIEDNLVNLRLVEAILAKRPGTELVSAMQGRLGLEMARLHRPDLILLDLHLPDMNGEAVLEELKRDPITSSIPVVMLTADSFPRTRTRLQAAGVYAFLSKPLNVDEFLQVLAAAAMAS
jgi:signal transduction histidine kinase/ActR/RegA family two-component response regulator